MGFSRGQCSATNDPCILICVEPPFHPIPAQNSAPTILSHTSQLVHVYSVAAQRIAVQLPQAHRTICQKANDLVRAAVGCNGVFGDKGVELPIAVSQ
jgi:hypothetical protein